MAELPSALQKRQILHDERASHETLNGLADAFGKAGRFGEALEMLAITRDETRLRALRQHAVSHGEVFLLTQTERLLGDEAPAKDWIAVAEKALSDERFRQAQTAFERAGDAGRAAEVGAKIPAPPPCRPEKAVEPDGSPAGTGP